MKFNKEFVYKYHYGKKHSNKNCLVKIPNMHATQKSINALRKNIGWFMGVTCLGSRMNNHSNNHKKNLTPPHNLKQTKT